MGIDPGEKRLRPALPVGVDVVVDVEERLVFGGGGDGARTAEFGGGDVPARHVDVGGVVDAPLLQTGEQIVEPVDPFRIDARGIVAAAVVDLVVVVVDADDVEAEGRQPVGQLLRLLPVGQLGVADEVRAVETDRNSRAVAEDEFPFRRDDERTVFSRRGVEKSGEIQRAVLFDVPVISEGLPLLSGGGDDGGLVNVAESRAERSRFAVADLKIEGGLADLLPGVGQESDADAEAGAVPLAPILNAEKEIPFKQDLAGDDRESELLDRAGNHHFPPELFRKRNPFAVRFEGGGAVERNRQRALQAEKFDGGGFRKFRCAADVCSAISHGSEGEGEFSRRRAGNLEIVPQLPGAVRRGPVFFQPEYHRPRGGLEGVPFFGEGGERDSPVVEFQGGVVEQLRLCGGECAAQQNVGCKEKSVSHYECFFLLDTFIVREIALGCAALVKPAMLLDLYKIISYSGV